MGEFATRPLHEPLPPRVVQAFPLHTGKKFLVTGAAGGAGFGVAKLLLEEGARVALLDIREDRLGAALDQLGGLKGQAISVVVDAGSPASIAKAAEAAESALGGIDGLVNCAAVTTFVSPLETPWAVWEKTFAVNVFGAFELSRLVAKSMIARNVKGAIVNVSSEAGKKGHTENLAYSASKAALINVTRMLSAELAPFDINVNCVCPGGMATEMLRAAAAAYAEKSGMSVGEIFDQLVSSQLRRHIQPVELAQTISFLLSDAAIIIRGQAINTDGGDTPY